VSDDALFFDDEDLACEDSDLDVDREDDASAAAVFPACASDPEIVAGKLKSLVLLPAKCPNHPLRRVASAPLVLRPRRLGVRASVRSACPWPLLEPECLS
jgi:hypothetical protein